MQSNIILKAIIWCRKNIFINFVNTVFSIIFLIFIFKALYLLIEWGLFNAVFVAKSRIECIDILKEKGLEYGACWPFITERLRLLFYGLYPAESIWRINLTGLITLTYIALIFMVPKLRVKYILSFLLIIIMPLLIYFLISGGHFGLQKVQTTKWGGLTLTLVLSVLSFLFSIGISILLALGRASNMPLVKTFCIFFIELLRSVPLITLLFVSSVLLPLFLPQDAEIDRLVRVIILITLFLAAYLAECIRGGLISIPKGQYETVDSLGLSYWQGRVFFIIPQALKNSIPSITNSFISTLKDTSLVVIIGMIDLLGIVQMGLSSPNWLGAALEGYIFLAFVYWIMCYILHRVSLLLEKKMSNKTEIQKI